MCSHCGIPVPRSDGPPVVVRSDSRFVVRGRLDKPAKVYFGIAVSGVNGEFAGKFRLDLESEQPISEPDEDGQQYESVAEPQPRQVHDLEERIAATYAAGAESAEGDQHCTDQAQTILGLPIPYLSLIAFGAILSCLVLSKGRRA